MVMYLNLHMALEQMRERAEVKDEPEVGPRVSYFNTKITEVCTVFLHSFIHSSFHLFIHPFFSSVHFLYSFIYLFICSFIHSSFLSFIYFYSSIRPFCLLIFSFIHSFIYFLLNATIISYFLFFIRLWLLVQQMLVNLPCVGCFSTML